MFCVLEWTVGPIPVVDDHIGKEVISKFTSDLHSGKILLFHQRNS